MVNDTNAGSSTTFEISWWIAITGVDAKIFDSVLVDFANAVWDLIEDKRFNDLNILLSHLKVAQMSTLAIEAVLRYTYAVRSKSFLNGESF